MPYSASTASSSSQRWHLWVLLGFFVVSSGGLYLVHLVKIPYPEWPAQALSYHQFADSRPLCAGECDDDGEVGRPCVPNFGDVVSNAPFLLTGALGLLLLRKTKAGSGERIQYGWEKVAFFVVFSFVFLTAIGSAYYHWEPSNSTLFWDRLPMGVMFMALFAIVIGERLGMRLGGILLWPLILTGFASVVYWHWSETTGNGDIRPYALVQFFPLLTMPFLLVVRKGPYTGDPFIFLTLGFYLLAKVLEAADRQIFALSGEMVSGHSLKHVAAAVATYWIYRWFRDRRAVRQLGS